MSRYDEKQTNHVYFTYFILFNFYSSFGDLRLKEPVPLVISDPEITVEELTPKGEKMKKKKKTERNLTKFEFFFSFFKDEFVIIASDGLWDVLTDQKAVDIVKKCETSEEAARKLVQVCFFVFLFVYILPFHCFLCVCFFLIQTALELGTMDNTTAIVVRFNWSLDFLTDSEIQGKETNFNSNVKTNVSMKIF